MKRRLNVLLFCSICLVAAASNAEWVTEENGSLLGGYSVKNTETGQELSVRYKTEKRAKKAAKALNKGDKSVMANENGDGDMVEGGELPFGK